MTSAMESLFPLVAKARAWLEANLGGRMEMTPRARILLAAAAGLLVLSVWIGLGQLASYAGNRLQGSQGDLLRLKKQIESGSWADRRQESRVLRNQLEDRFWTAETAGLAAASYESWIRDQLTRLRVEPQQITVQRTPVAADESSGGRAPQDLQRMTAKVMLPFDAPALLGFLANIAENNKTVIVERLIVRAGRNPRTEMDISTFIRLPAESRKGQQ